MPLITHNSTTTDLIVSLFDITLSQDVPFHKLHKFYTHHRPAFVLNIAIAPALALKSLSIKGNGCHFACNYLFRVSSMQYFQAKCQ